MKRFIYYLPIAVLLVLFAMPAVAQGYDLVNVHFNSPVAVPGKILPAGNYVFHFLNQDSSTRFVNVEKKNGKTAAGFIMMFPTYTEHAPGRVVIRTSKPDRDGVVRFRSMYLPGQLVGYRFIYTKADRRQLDMIAQRMQQKTAAGM